MRKSSSAARPDPLFPHAALLPLAEPGGGHTPLPNTPSLVRPLSARLAVSVPPMAKKHDTNPSSWVEKEPTQRSKDGEVIPDTIDIVKTDT